MPKFIVGARGHDFGRHNPLELFTAIGDAGYRCTQLAYCKAVEGISGYSDVTPAVVEATKEAIAKTGVTVAVMGTYVDLGLVDETRRKAETAKLISQIPTAKAVNALCMGSETTNMASQPGVTRAEAQKALLRSLAEIMPAVEEQGVIMGIEAVCYHAMNDPEAVKMVLDSIASPNLKVIFDLGNLIGPADTSLDAQRRMWDRVANCYGEKIVAVHFKGMDYTPDGKLRSTSLEASVLDYEGGFAMLRALPQESLPVLREEAVPARSASDIAFMQRYF